MSQDYNSSNGGEYPAAVAAAAFAISSLEELSTTNKKKMSEGADTSLTKIKSETEDTRSLVSEAGKVTRQFPGKPSMEKIEVPDKIVPMSSATNEKMPEKAIGPIPSIKKTPTFSDKHLDSTASKKSVSASSKPDLPSAKQPAFPTTDFRRQSSTKPGIGETEADIWEKADMAKIKERLNWSTKEQKPWNIRKELIKVEEEKELKQRKTEEMRSSR